MRTIIYYFSATGNSLKVAKDLAQELGEADIVPITKALGSDEADSFDTVGIIFPVYMFGLPLIVADFLKKIKIKNAAYVFCVATFGGLQGRALGMARDILKQRAIQLGAGFAVRMPGNYIPLSGAQSQEQQKKMFSKESERVKEIAVYARGKKQGIMQEQPFLPNFLLYKLLYKGGSRMIPSSDRDFWFTDACTKCGLCAKVCPVANIKLQDGHPQWLHHCQHCMACLQWCPVEAIQYKKTTLGRKRYHHPAVTAQDIMQQR